MTIYARAPLDAKPLNNRITPGREYPVLEGDERHHFILNDFDLGPHCFSIRNDHGATIFCVWECCAHLAGAAWERVERPDGEN